MSTHADKRLPRPTPLSQPWWDACKKQKLLIQQCGDCGHFQFYPRNVCTACGSTGLEWFQTSGKGRVRSYTIIRHPVSKAYADEVPYTIALVQLDEGPTLMSALTACDPDSIRIGQQLEVVFERWTEEVTVPKFRPA